MRYTLAAPILMLGACGGASEAPTTNKLATDIAAANAHAEPTPVAATTPYPVEACKAAIGAMMGRNPATMKSKRHQMV